MQRTIVLISLALEWEHKMPTLAYTAKHNLAKLATAFQQIPELVADPEEDARIRISSRNKELVITYPDTVSEQQIIDVIKNHDSTPSKPVKSRDAKIKEAVTKSRNDLDKLNVDSGIKTLLSNLFDNLEDVITGGN